MESCVFCVKRPKVLLVNGSQPECSIENEVSTKLRILNLGIGAGRAAVAHLVVSALLLHGV